MSENAPYDLVCDTGTKLLRIQVKYRQNGSHTNNIDTTKIFTKSSKRVVIILEFIII